MAGNRIDRWAEVAVLTLALSVLVVAGGVAGLLARPGDAAIAVFAPWTGLDHSLAAVDRAGARVLGYGARGWIIAATGPDLQTALGREGAWLFLDMGRARMLCGLAPAG